MEIEVIENKKNKLIFNLKGADHTVCNILKKELYNDDHIKVAAYNIKHPLIGIPQITVETDGNEAPKNAILSAIQRVKKLNDSFSRNFLKEAK